MIPIKIKARIKKNIPRYVYPDISSLNDLYIVFFASSSFLSKISLSLISFIFIAP